MLHKVRDWISVSSVVWRGAKACESEHVSQIGHLKLVVCGQLTDETKFRTLLQSVGLRGKDDFCCTGKLTSEHLRVDAGSTA